MQAFVMRLNKGERKYECFVQQIADKGDDIFIVNFKDSCLIRLFRGSKALFYLRRKPDNRGLKEGKERQLQEHVWNAIVENESVI